MATGDQQTDHLSIPDPAAVGADADAAETAADDAEATRTGGTHSQQGTIAAGDSVQGLASSAATDADDAQQSAQAASRQAVSRLHQARAEPNYWTDRDKVDQKRFSGGAAKTDRGTIIIPAGDSVTVRWEAPPIKLRGEDIPPRPIYFLIVQIAPIKGAAGMLTCTLTSRDTNDPPGGWPRAFSEGPAGIYTHSFTPWESGRWHELEIANGGAEAVEILTPTVTDEPIQAAVPPLQPVPVAQRVGVTRDALPFRAPYVSGRRARESKLLDAVVGPAGSDSDAGTLRAPYASISAAPTAVDQLVGLIRGGQWRETWDSAQGQHLVGVKSGAPEGGGLPVVSAYDQVPEGDFSQAQGPVYQADVTVPGESGELDGYDNVTAMAVLKSAAAPAPSGVGELLEQVPDVETCEATPGSCYAAYQDQSASLVRFYVHLPDSGTPSGSAYRTEVTTRSRTIDASSGGNEGPDDVVVTGLHILGSIAGYGPAPLPGRSVLERSVVEGGHTHHSVIGSGSRVEDVLYTGSVPGMSGSALTFYEGDAGGGNATARRVSFLGVHDCVLCHNSNGEIFGTLRFEDVRAYDCHEVITVQDCQRVEVRDLYAADVAEWLKINATPEAGIVEGAWVNGCEGGGVKEQGGSPHLPYFELTDSIIKTKQLPESTDYGAVGAITCADTDEALVEDCIFWGYSPTNETASGRCSVFAGVGDGMTMRRNILIAQGTDTHYAGFHSDIDLGGSLGSTENYKADYNAYILVGGKDAPIWGTDNNPESDSTIKSLDKLQAVTGEEQHSILIDLRDDPRGLKAIFRDPLNGNFRFAATEEAQRVAALGAGPREVPAAWPEKPTQTEAVRAIERL